MLVLLCAVTIGQIEDVAKLRERYEKSQATYEKVQAMHARAVATYEEALKRDATRNGQRVLPRISTNPKGQAIRDRLKEHRIKLEKLRERHLQQMEILLRRLKQQVDSLKWQYERAAGRPSEHFA